MDTHSLQTKIGRRPLKYFFSFLFFLEMGFRFLFELSLIDKSNVILHPIFRRNQRNMIPRSYACLHPGQCQKYVFVYKKQTLKIMCHNF